ncbi:MAG: EAL domain-containing response regulator [Planctomycetes bacterium]|nr:EAL domain-containing response regulator [Planctomycetota bacterium]
MVPPDPLPALPTAPPTRAAEALWLVARNADGGLTGLLSALEESGYEVTSTPPEAAATAAWEGHVPGLVLIDLRGDAAAGLAFLAELRGDALWAQVPALMLHDGDDPDVIARALAAGADEFLEAPFVPALLEHRLNQALRRTVQVLRELDELEAAGDRCRGGLCGGERFALELRRGIERSATRDESVAVLAVGAADEDVGRVLARAVLDFEDAGAISHPRGAISITREEGVHLVCVPSLARVQDAARLGYALQAALRERCGHDVPIGVANFPVDGNEAAALCRAATASLSTAREVGSSALRFHSEGTDRWVFERLTLERSLRHALERDELVLYYQPKVEAATRRLTGFEALVRWKHPELGMVSPAQFIPLAEETGLIVPIGEWVLETACKQNKAWQDAGFAPVRMAVNLSPLQFREPGLADKVHEVLERVGLAPQHLELEVTESMLMHDIRETIDTLGRIKQAGVYLSIDDFGTGYSSLSYLKGFPIDALKIDQSFIRDVTSNTDDAAIATSIILMGRSLNLKVIAEGVETEKQLAFLQVLQCNEIQGYLISPPVPAEQAQGFLAQG